METNKDLDTRINETRKGILTSLFYAESGHPGPCLSVTEIVGTLFFNEMNLLGNERDIFILSKGHAAPAVYSALAVRGELDFDELKTLRKIGSPLQGHPVRGTLSLIDASTGSLGQGLSIGIGYALGKKLNGHKGGVYVIIGDGESNEGQIWEAAMSASKFASQGRMSPLIAILDYNGFQNSGSVESIMPLEPLRTKWESFGWNVQEVDGHNTQQLIDSYKIAKNCYNKPNMIIAKTVKGRGVSFMEGRMDWHSRAMKQEEYSAAMKELGENY